ncbi:TATA box-binding protein associated factor RNA polymerase I subunit C [Melia azedarach]|uniref:TATA box-binding protein associated factor RNA polymerase I subunit C n=1 Tax=Melia azedarach TaxID=155640 RepID=A0ACC1YCE3_MELAZ|nr:TATA box-binding protein associated factor RNA polymerase I subunit C [Melia azedarach]
MELTDEWKSVFPVAKIFKPPLLLSSSSSRSVLGPVFFNPNPETLTLLFSSPSLCAPLPLPLPQLSLTRFLSTSSSIPLSTSSSIASQFGPQTPLHTVSDFSFNRLRLLHCPIHNSILAFFPTGFNHDQLGFLLVSCKESGLVVLGDDKNKLYTTNHRFNGQICGILINPVEDEDISGNSLSTVGYLLVFTMYSVHWFSVKVSEISEKPVLGYLGFKLFKSCSVVAACWSPHLLQESVVLLQSGALFMFDMDSTFQTRKLNQHFKGKRLRVSWNDDSVGSQSCKWLGCEFSWHPRILIVARSDAVFLVDLRSDRCNVSLLAKIDMLDLCAPVEKERFLAFCKAGSHGFNFVLVSDSSLVFCDVRKPMTPLLQWAHGLDKPTHVESFRLSELRSNSRDDKYDWANESGFGIVLGSFWNCEFSLFCCGPSLPGQGEPSASKISKFCKSLYAWELPSDLLLSGRDCRCGNCLVREEFLKGALPKWINWQQRKDIVLGFGILSRDLSVVLHEADEFGGFTLIRLMSSGKLEAQRYCASWKPVKRFELAHRNSLFDFENNLLCSKGDEDYKFPKRFKYCKLDYLSAYLGGNLTELIDSKMKKSANDPQEKGSFSIDIHETLCEKLKDCGFGRFRTSPAISFVFNDLSMPASIHEVALRRIWTCLPIELLQLAFSSYIEILEVLLDKNKPSLEMLAVPDLPQLPPFFLRKLSCRSNKWSQKVQRSDAIVGPVLPLPILVTLDEIRNGCLYSEVEAEIFSPEAELGLRCNEVMQVASEMAVSDSTFEFHDDHAVSLANEKDEMWFDSQKSKPFIVYHPIALDSSAKDHELQNSVYKDVWFSNMILKVADWEPSLKDKVDGVALDLFDDLSPIPLKYDACSMNISFTELKTYSIIKRQFSRWQEGFSLYQDFCTQFNLKKQ